MDLPMTRAEQVASTAYGELHTKHKEIYLLAWDDLPAKWRKCLALMVTAGREDACNQLDPPPTLTGAMHPPGWGIKDDDPFKPL